MGENKHDPALAALAAELVTLPSLDEDELFLIWRTRIGRRVPKHLPRYLLTRLLAYRIQAQAFGDLDRNTRSRLEQHALEKPSSREGAMQAPSHKRVTPKAGSVLVREHQGALHRVMVLDAGYAWSGQTYKSLSQVAFAITGTKWNGPRFFGLDKNKPGHAKGSGQ